MVFSFAQALPQESYINSIEGKTAGRSNVLSAYLCDPSAVCGL
jgi:hypothetical protein